MELTTPIEAGGVTSPEGFSAGCTASGIKSYGPEPRFDLGVLLSDRACAVAGVLTQNLVTGAPVELCRERLTRGSARGVVVNSGCSNVATGAQGLEDARRMAELAATRVGVSGEELLVASTGVIGRRLPMGKLEAGLAKVTLARDGGIDFARAIMTTDTVVKSRAVRVALPSGKSCVIGGAAKGSGMVHPDMATVLCFLTTDAAASPSFLKSALKHAADDSLNMLDVDMDTSTSDTMLLFANGAAFDQPLEVGQPDADAFVRGLRALCIELARDLARDGEGASTLIEVHVRGARDQRDARLAARTIVSSPLVKTMVNGRDPNLGRVLAALGRSGARVDPERTSVHIGKLCAFENGAASAVPFKELSAAMNAPEVQITVGLGLGDGSATAYGCDLTEGYVRINADYTT